MRGQRHAPAALYPRGKTRYPLYRRLGGPQGRSGQVGKISPLLGFDPRTVQCVASRYTDYATRPTIHKWQNLKITIHHIYWHCKCIFPFLGQRIRNVVIWRRCQLYINPLKPELNPICYLLALLGAHHCLHVSRIRVKLLTLSWLMSYIYGAPILDVSRSHTTTHHSR